MATQGILPRFTAALHDAVLRICECVGQQRTAVATIFPSPWLCAFV